MDDVGNTLLVKVTGGLGNQLFQYAAGRAIADRLGMNLKFDFQFYDRQHTRRRQLHLMNTVLTPPTARERFVAAMVQSRPWKRLRSLAGNRVPHWVFNHVVDAVRGFDPAVFTLNGHVLLDGYWQSERYFTDIAGALRRELTFRDPPDAHNAQWVQRIDACHAAGIHVRRTDYLTTGRGDGVHRACEPTYYRRAMAHLRDRHRDVRFFVFSDDPDWAAANLDVGPDGVVVRHNGDARSHEDLRLMTRCKHMIIANSTFSWWGAWLTPDVGKTVIAPKVWLADLPEHNHDIVPADWLRM